MSRTATSDTTETLWVDAPCSGDIPPGWVAWDMPCGCREAASEDNQTLTVRCAAECQCWQCARPAEGQS